MVSVSTIRAASWLYTEQPYRNENRTLNSTWIGLVISWYGHPKPKFNKESRTISARATPSMCVPGPVVSGLAEKGN
jgi:hypothetical protein